ncbi:GNAT family N-acetyltransferase [Liquorilactobacillus oeni]|uniref:N-acetyltransferase GCN5 n=1 Tax=Liquorilactobacillus oeni DSM 19972 TaxID=1423777 RepID=A0A0R1MI38_9LACO|nr:GNAT family N-acetyltransferase [Liquorilactobacillus oeni]KRL04810.1 N-acetyltransferase GCN5 [Liquorilactobacillus oeni DSM 19972]
MIRQATKEDAAEIVPLFNIILEEMELPALKTLSRTKLDLALKYAFASSVCRTDFAKTIVAEVKGKIAGFAFGYPNEHEKKINQELVKFFPKVGFSPETQLFEDDECFKGEWYLDSIAVNPSFQRKGIGTQLLNALPKIAKSNNKSCIGLNVDWENPAAEKLYRQLGFKKVGMTTLSQHKYNHLQKLI